VNAPTVSHAIQQLVNYGLDTGLILPDDEIYIRNQLLLALGLDSFEEAEDFDEDACYYTDLEAILTALTDDAVRRGVCEDNSTARDLFDTRLMGVLTPRPSIVRANFEERYEADGPQAATDWFYQFSQDTDYIRRYRIKKDLKWVTKTPYGDLDITINLSKPEKDPKAIAAAKLAPQSAYPKCQLCMENEGYAGRMNHPARENHRIIPVTIHDSDWCFQYSPYVYYNEHCIVFNSRHTPMKIERATFRKLLDFVAQFPHYFVGSNADLPIVGGSILSHDHFQGGHYEFAMAKAPLEMGWVFPGFEDVDAGIVHWPMSCIRLTAASDERLVELADRILTAWRGYTDERCFIYAETDGEAHNTITPIARMRDGQYQLDLVLRNNITTPEHPLGVYHPHAKLHHIKKENIGLIEVMGLAVLPSRLKGEMAELEQALVARTPAAQYSEALQKHAAWADEILARHPELDAVNARAILQKEIGLVFAEVLADAGVYKQDKAGRAGFARFLESVR
jgi:UDPglucose--hexose-1-phosphate uridylyltransferase